MSPTRTSIPYAAASWKRQPSSDCVKPSPQAEDNFSLFDVRQTGNELIVLYAHGLRNHRFRPVIELFRWVAAELPESYGLLYAHDDEAEGQDNEFRVWRLRGAALKSGPTRSCHHIPRPWSRRLRLPATCCSPGCRSWTISGPPTGRPRWRSWPLRVPGAGRIPTAVGRSRCESPQTPNQAMQQAAGVCRFSKITRHPFRWSAEIVAPLLATLPALHVSETPDPNRSRKAAAIATSAGVLPYRPSLSNFPNPGGGTASSAAPPPRPIDTFPEKAT